MRRCPERVHVELRQGASDDWRAAEVTGWSPTGRVWLTFAEGGHELINLATVEHRFVQPL